MTGEEIKLNNAIAEWRAAEDQLKRYEDYVQVCRDKMITMMHSLGLKAQQTSIGRVSLSPTKKCNIVVDRREFENRLKQQGMYDQFCETKLSLDKVKKYVESNDDDLYGMVEVETNYRASFIPAKDE